MIMALGLHKIHYVASGWRRWRVPGIFIGIEAYSPSAMQQQYITQRKRAQDISTIWHGKKTRVAFSAYLLLVWLEHTSNMRAYRDTQLNKHNSWNWS